MAAQEMETHLVECHSTEAENVLVQSRLKQKIIKGEVYGIYLEPILHVPLSVDESALLEGVL